MLQVQASGERRERRDKGIRLMTPRDRWVMQWIAEQYALRFDHLRKLLSRDSCARNPAKASGPGGITTSSAFQVIARWNRSPQWAEYQRLHVDRPGWIWLTPYGLQVLGLTYSRHVVRESTLDHLHGINRVRLDIEQRHPEYCWMSERTLRANHSRREEGEHSGHVPDAQILTPEQRRIAVEVELSPKDDSEIDEILHCLLLGSENTSSYQMIWYFVSSATAVNEQAKRVVEQARKRLPEDLCSQVQVIDLERLVI